MLFNSFPFIFLFLPPVALLFFAIGRHHRYDLAAGFLGGASLIFYAWWNPAFVPLLLGSISFNYLIGRAIVHPHYRAISHRLVALGIVGNLSALFYYKYAAFAVTTVNQIAGTRMPSPHVTLPIGISFFTFTQIAYLVDAMRGNAREYKFTHYLLFVVYFPHLIAGPILHHAEMMPQFQKRDTYRLHWNSIAVGLTIFVIGLFKKVIVADAIVAPYVPPAFLRASQGATIGLLEGWAGAIAYTLQLYFDFSGYSDMAIGLSRLFNVTLPLNFDSPYKAASIIEFWQRWHMTLSRFLRDYLYIPLGGNRRGALRRYANLLVTMLLGGLWHGASWTFVGWGGLHGIYLMVNHGIRYLRPSRGGSSHGAPRLADRLTRALGRGTTFLAVLVGWVFFRADSIASALRMLKGMAGINGVVLPLQWQERLSLVLGGHAGALGFGETPGFSGGGTEVVWLLFFLVVVWVGPNTQQIMRHHQPALDYDGTGTEAPGLGRLEWRPTVPWLAVIVTAAVVSIARLTDVTDFLYFQF